MAVRKVRPSKEKTKRAPLASPGRRRARPPAKPEPRVRLDVDERRAQLVTLGVERFGTLPYDEVSIDDLASAAGISKGLLYHYFPTKKAFYAASIREAARHLVESTEARRKDLPPLEALDAGIDAYLDFVRAHGRAYATLMRSGVGVDPEIAGIVDETRRAFVHRIMSGFEAQPLVKITPMLDLALRGWVGLAEASSLAWVDAHESGRPAPSQAEVRGLLATSLLELVRIVVGAA